MAIVGQELRRGWKNRVRGVRGCDVMSALEDWAVQGDRDSGQGRWREC